MNHYQPYGRVSARDRERRHAGWDLRFAVLMVFPIICLIVVLYEFLYLQQYTANGAQDAALQERNARLRTDEDLLAASMPSKAKSAAVATKPATIVNGRRTMILIANYRDSKRCSETLKSIFDNALSPDLITISVFDQIYAKDGEKPCVEVFCELVGESSCRRSQLVSRQIDAADAKVRIVVVLFISCVCIATNHATHVSNIDIYEPSQGPTAARYETEKAITDEDFCMAIDSHLVFIKNWDEKVVSQWESVKNPNAIITVYPKSTEHMESMETDTNVQLMCHSRIESEDPDSMIQYGAPIWLNKRKVPKPRLMSQLAGGFNFGNCKQAKEIRNDPYTPYLFHGEEYSRAARLWTHGYDFYVPSEDIVYHWYEPRKVVWERDWGERYVVQQASKRRIRYALGLPVTKQDFDRTELDKFKLGTKRTMAQWIKFSGIDPLAKYIGTDVEQFKNCGILEYVPYE